MHDIFQPTLTEEVVAAGPLRALRWAVTDLQAPHTFLMIHGLWSGAHVWRRLGPYLASHGYTTYAVWQRHHQPGADHAQLEGLGIGDYSSDVEAAARDIGAPILVGFSLGGLVAQQVAARSSAAGLVLLGSTAPWGIPTLQPGLRTLEAIPRFLGRPIRPGPLRMDFPYVRETCFSHLTDAEAEAHLAHHVPEPRRVARELAFWPPRVPASRIRSPVMVAAGTEDRAIAPWVARRLAARYRVIPTLYSGRGHMLPLEPGWEKVGDDLMLWADRFVA